MRRRIFFSIIISCILAMNLMVGCDSADGKAETSADAPDGGEASDKEKDAYDQYIKDALSSVGGNAPTADGDAQNAPAATVGKDISAPRTAANDFAVSSMEGGDVNDPNSDAYDPFAKPTEDPEASLSPTVDPNATPTPSPTPYITPEEFEVGKCCIYINGESDSAYGTEVVTAINKARTDLGYKGLVNNKGLATCADRRTREIAANFSHTRPNGLFFTSVAPEHFKAEMLIIDNQKAESTVDALIKNDIISRNLIFTEKYQSIGASSFKCNGMRYTVVAFGL